MTDSGVTVGYLMSRFPKLSETFVVDEIRAVEARGVTVELFPLIHEREAVRQPDAEHMVARAHFQPVLSLQILRSIVTWLVTDPRVLAATVWEAFRGVFPSVNFTVGLIGILPKTLHNARVMRTLGIDHVHAHFAHHPALAALVIHRLTGIPFSFTGHGHDIQVDRRMLCEKIAAARFAVAIAEHNRDLMTEGCPALRSKVALLHTGVDPSAVPPGRPTAWADRQWPAEGLRILSIGRLEEVKGHRVLLDACAQLARDEVPAQAIIVGDGPLQESLERQRRSLGLDGRVRLAGSVTRPQVFDLVRSADVVALPSIPTADGRQEGIPVVLMEAMSLERAVVASDLPGVRELVRSDAEGLLFPAGDHRAMADALGRLAQDPALRSRLGHGGRARITRSFDAADTASALVALFRSSAAGRPLGDLPGPPTSNPGY